MDYYTSSTTNPSSSQFSSSKPNKNNKKTAKKCKGVRLSTDPQSVAARERRHRISDRFKILQSMVPGGTKMDTVSMLEEAIQYVKYLKTQIWLHQTIINFMDDTTTTTTTTATNNNNNTNIINESSSYSLPSPMYPSDFCRYFTSDQFMISPQQNATFDHNNNMQNQPQYCSFQQGELDTTYFDGSLKYWPA